MGKILPQIDHIVVLMMENRSFDNLVGWLYDQDISPSNWVIPDGNKQYEGLAFGDYTNPNAPGNEPAEVPVQRGTDNYFIPAPDPQESFSNMTKQLFGEEIPVEGHLPKMKGFLRNYFTVEDADAQHIMQTYSPEQVPVMSGIARDFAISDAWHASSPTQTSPNRAFVAAGTSEGRVNNSEGVFFGAETIFNVLENHGVSWKVYKSSLLMPSLTRTSFTKLWDPLLDFHFNRIDDFIKDCEKGELPAYSFLEPEFLGDTLGSVHGATSEHPPSDVSAGEVFLLKIWNAVRASPNWDKTLFILTYDEHGGCYDHVPPPWGAAIPDEKSRPGGEGFYFDRFGVRIPTIMASPYIPTGTVFRSLDPNETPYDHTSIIATVLDWQGIDRSEIPSQRVAVAPTFESVLSLTTPRTDAQVELEAPRQPEGRESLKYHLLSDLERWVSKAHMHYSYGGKISHDEVDKHFESIHTLQDANEHLRSTPGLKSD